MRFFWILIILLMPMTARAQTLTVFAAASLTDVMKDISAKWVEAGHQPLRLSFGSSSTLARQIEQGAPVNLFASADEKWMDYLADNQLIAVGTRADLLGNDLVLVVEASKPMHLIINKNFDLAGLLRSDGRLAIGNPAHVPVGIYAEQALKALGMWDSVSSRLARAEDVRAALLLVERGEAPAGIVYATDAAVSNAVMIAGRFPADSHDPISYPFAIMKSGDTAEARALFAFLTSPRARAEFARRGFKVE